MGTLVIRCPNTGLPISTGRFVDSAAFRSSPVFFSRTYCSRCRAVHEWFARDAWVCEAENAECKLACECKVVRPASKHPRLHPPAVQAKQQPARHSSV